MEWSDIRIFLAIARAGTLQGAARAAGQTQPTMGRRLRALEEDVGHALFQRTANGLVLTDEGSAMLGHAERMEQEALALARTLAGHDDALEGTIRVSSSDWFGVHVLSPVIAAFVQAHPRVSVELLTDARLLDLARREADLVFRILPFDAPDIAQRKLMRMEYGLYAARDAAPPPPGDGTGIGLVTMDTAFAGLPDVQWLHALLPNAHVVFRSNNREAQARLCAAGVGVAVLPCLLAARIDGLRRIDTPTAPPARDVWVGYHKDLRRVPRLRALLDATLAALGTEGTVA
ncbi:LysR family transcriptional regulator [Cupriavidus plantarum]|uniref:LysR family transcriptional regulator n=1 Tax=Cupriavidus plantarum TaxID=942865 RepID=UPI0015CB2CB2|nr:LysR family transcriptional regulator [Cupriavidus plantarum]NYI00695.1 DNA-binding transcriptional LysR family regulator [Cupriavidus plantarum]